MQEMERKKVDITMQHAAERGCIDIVKLCKKWGANNFGDVMCDAAENGTLRLSNCVKNGRQMSLIKTRMM